MVRYNVNSGNCWSKGKENKRVPEPYGAVISLQLSCACKINYQLEGIAGKSFRCGSRRTVKKTHDETPDYLPHFPGSTVNKLVKTFCETLSRIYLLTVFHISASTGLLSCQLYVVTPAFEIRGANSSADKPNIELSSHPTPQYTSAQSTHLTVDSNPTKSTRPQANITLRVPEGS